MSFAHRPLSIVHEPSNTVLAGKAVLAEGFLIRAQGMITREFDETLDALIFPNCGSVHTWFMKIPLDLLFLDLQRRVLGWKEQVRPWRWVCGPKGTKYVIELPEAKLCGISISYQDPVSWA
jgi:uncharacterized protein